MKARGQRVSRSHSSDSCLKMKVANLEARRLFKSPYTEMHVFSEKITKLISMSPTRRGKLFPKTSRRHQEKWRISELKYLVDNLFDQTQHIPQSLQEGVLSTLSIRIDLYRVKRAMQQKKPTVRRNQTEYHCYFKEKRVALLYGGCMSNWNYCSSSINFYHHKS